jgi:purine-nucleoside phosphorylase
MTLHSRINEAVAFLRPRARRPPESGIILGSGLGAVADAVGNAESVLYEEIPYFPVPTTEGHRGRLVLGDLGGRPVAVMQGRCHLYEGYTPGEVTFPVRVLAALGARTLIVTNAAGGLNPRFRPGDLMVITDHINFQGTNPLVGPNDDTLGPRFPDMSRAYDPEVIALAVRAASEEGIPLHTGVYAGVLGPSYETPAEVRMLKQWGADAVGMSTVAEVIVARHADVRVFGCAAITNVVPDGPGALVAHAEVLRAARELEPRFLGLVRRLMRDLPRGGAEGSGVGV